MDRSAISAGQTPAYFYELDAEDRIVSASESWDEFARENGGEHLVFARVSNTKIWDHIADPKTAALYRRIYASARRGRSVRFFLRCDSPTVRRMLSVTVEKNSDNDRLRVSTLLFRADLRDQVSLRADNDADADMSVPVCSWCEKVRLPGGDWQEVEGAAAFLDRQEPRANCQISYAICPGCLARIEDQLDRAR